MTGPSLRERGNAVTYEEINEDEFDSPPAKKQPKGKKMQVVSSDEEEENPGLLKYAKHGVNNTKVDLENFKFTGGANKRRAGRGRDKCSNKQRRVSLEDEDEDDDRMDPISDSEAEPETRTRRTRRAAAAPVNYKLTSDSEAGSEDDEAQHASDEEPLLDAMSESSSEDEEDGSDDESQSEAEEEEEAAPRRLRLRRVAATKTRTAPEPSRRSGRGAATRTVNYNDHALDAEIAEALEALSSDDDDDDVLEDSEAENKPPAGRGRSTRNAASKNKKKKVASRKPVRMVLDDDSSEGSSSSEDGSGTESDASHQEEGSESDDEVDLDEDAEKEEELDERLLSKVERILSIRTGGDDAEEQVYVKFEGRSFRAARWVSKEAVMAYRAQLVRNFEKKAASGALDPYGDLEHGVHADWLTIDRIAAQRAKRNAPGERVLLVKWKGLGYTDATWEDEKTLKQPGDVEAIQRYDACKQRKDSALSKETGEGPAAGAGTGGYWDAPAGAAPAASPGKLINLTAVPVFQNGRQLRDYQKESLKWMAKHRYRVTKGESDPTNCILGDEMGLGKTAQSIAVLEHQRQFGQGGTFLIVAPLTTLGHWQREIETWTTMDVVVYAGSSSDRAVIQKYDLWVPGPGRKRDRQVKPDVILTSFDTLLRDRTLFQEIYFDSVIIDEAHRLKSTGSATRQAVQGLHVEWLLLLTGTPVQNNMRELYGLLNLLDPVTFDSEESFLEDYGDERVGMSPQQVRALQEVLRPILLRRMKEDVENLPEKEEVIIWTELTKEQRAYYKAIYENQIGTLLSGTTTKNLPNLRNLAMELRKVCCHPCLCDGLEQDMAARRAAHGDSTSSRDLLVSGSGKMVLLDKLLPKLRSEGRKVLIFSQFKMMLDVLEDYLNASGYPMERIDGSTGGRDRQAAIDRFSRSDSDSFVFLLSTRAGGQGITLTAADTCIIYDSDWNPQNDLQAMARCHRIGQDKDVTIYRLVCRDTYEQHVFQTSSRKYGLDEAILGTIGTSTGGAGGSSRDGGDPEADGKKIADLLKHGAHCLDVEGGNEATDAFATEDIDQILQGRTEKRQIGSRAGNTFSVATFAVAEKPEAGEDLEKYWATLLPEAAAKHAAAQAAGGEHIILAPRARKKVDYSEEAGIHRRKKKEDAGSSGDADYNASDDESGDKSGGGVKKQGQAKDKASKPVKVKPRYWSKIDLMNFFESVMRFGKGRAAEARVHAGIEKHPLEECVEVERVLCMLFAQARNNAIKPPKKGPKVENFGADLIRAMADSVADPTAALQQNAKLMQEQAAQADQAKQEYDQQMEALAAEMVRSKGPMLPDAARPALDTKLTLKILRNIKLLSSHMDQRIALAKLATEWDAAGVDVNTAVNEIRLPFFPRKASIPLPVWWGRREDVHLLMGSHVLGLEPYRRQGLDVEAILTDPRFGFSSRVYKVVEEPTAVLTEKKAEEAGREDMVVDGPPVHAVPADSFKVQPDSASGGGVAAEEVVDKVDPKEQAHLNNKGGLSSAAWDKFVETALKQLKGLLGAIAARHLVGGPTAHLNAAMLAAKNKMAADRAGSSSSFDSNSLATAPPGSLPSMERNTSIPGEVRVPSRLQTEGRPAVPAPAPAPKEEAAAPTDDAKIKSPKSAPVSGKKRPAEKPATERLSDPISESFSDDDDDAPLPQKNKKAALPLHHAPIEATPALPKSQAKEEEAGVEVEGAPMTGATDATATPGDALEQPAPSLDLFAETRGQFSNSLTLKKAAAAGAAAGKGAAPKGGAKHWKQRSLFELKKVHREKRGEQQQQQEEGGAGQLSEAPAMEEEIEVVDLV